MRDRTIEELPFVVEEWSDGFKERQGTLARAVAADIAIAAFEEALKERPHRNLMVRSGMHVIRQREGDPPRKHSSGRRGTSAEVTG
jgi:hypothetical protein